MRATLLLVILTALAISEGPRVAQRAALNRDLVACIRPAPRACQPCSISLPARDPRTAYHIGVSALKAGHAEEAVDNLRAYANAPDTKRDDLAAYYLGLAYRQEGDEAAALAVWRAGGVARTFAAIGMRQGSVADLRTAIAAGASDPQIFFRLGDLLWDAGRLTEARTAYEEGVAVDDGQGIARLLAQARVAEVDGDLDEAVALDDRAIARQPDDSRGYLQMAALYRRERSYSRALDSLSRCVARTGAMTCYLQAGEISLSSGDRAAALRCGLDAAHAFPGKAEPLIFLGAAWRANRNFDEASRAYARAAAIDPQDFWIPIHQGDLAAEQGDFPQALRDYEKARALNGDSPAVYLSIGSACRRLGRLQDALAAFRRAATLDGGLIAARTAIAEIESAPGHGAQELPAETSHVR